MHDSANSIFQNSTLMISARSPFARRVRVALLEHGIPFEVRAFDVFKPNPELASKNPLSRVPTLILKDGRSLIESHLILQALYERMPASPFQSKDPDTRLSDSRLSAIATGICDKCIEYFIEKARPQNQHDAEWIEECTSAIERSLEALSHEFSKLGPGLRQVDFDIGIALAYVSLRYNENWKKQYPALHQYFEKLDARPSFMATRPPPA